MTTELEVLVYGCLLLIAHILIAVSYKTRQYGRAWNMGPRDDALPPLDAVPGRLARAQANFLETFPLAIVGMLGLALTGRGNEVTAIAAWVWLGARLIYLPLYWAGVPKIRTAVWASSMAALLVILAVLLFA